MKKVAFIIAISLLGTLTVKAFNNSNPIVSAADQIFYCKVFNNTSNVFEYKVGTDTYSIPVGQSSGFAFEENTQIMKKDSNGNWVNWFKFTSDYSNQTVQLSDIISLSN